MAPVALIKIGIIDEALTNAKAAAHKPTPAPNAAVLAESSMAEPETTSV